MVNDTGYTLDAGDPTWPYRYDPFSVLSKKPVVAIRKNGVACFCTSLGPITLQGVAPSKPSSPSLSNTGSQIWSRSQLSAFRIWRACDVCWTLTRLLSHVQTI